jgi:16S rRNA processing protein RimM
MLLGLETTELPEDAIEVGHVQGAWGIKGWFKVFPYSASPEAIFSSKRWFLVPSEKGKKNFDGVGKIKIRDTKTHSDGVVACAHEVDDRSAADALQGMRIFIARSSFPTAQKDEFYWVDLMGLDVINREGLLLGYVSDLLSAGPQTVLVIDCDGHMAQRLIPFVGTYVDDVDLNKRQILVDWQPDY